MGWAPTLEASLAAVAAVGALYLNLLAYGGGSMERLEKARAFLTGLAQVPAAEKPLMEARYYAIMRSQLSVGWIKGLAFLVFWFFVSMASFVIGIAQESPLSFFVVGLLSLVVMVLNFVEFLDLAKSPTALAQYELQRREADAYYRYSAKEKPPGKKPPKWALAVDQAVTGFIGRYKTSIQITFFAACALLVALMAAAYF